MSKSTLFKKILQFIIFYKFVLIQLVQFPIYKGIIFQYSIFIQQYQLKSMGIDLIRGGRIANRGFRKTKTSNTYIKTLIKLYSFLARRTDSKFNQTVHKRLNQSRLNRYPISISRIAKLLSSDNAKLPEGKTKYNARIVAIVGSITNDTRFLNVPEGLRVCALKFTTQARQRIEAAKGQCLTFDQLAQIAPKGQNVLLLRGTRDRQAKRHFGLYPGQKGSHSAPRVRCEGRHFQRARGRR